MKGIGTGIGIETGTENHLIAGTVAVAETWIERGEKAEVARTVAMDMSTNDETRSTADAGSTMPALPITVTPARVSSRDTFLTLVIALLRCSSCCCRRLYAALLLSAVLLDWLTPSEGAAWPPPQTGSCLHVVGDRHVLPPPPPGPTYGGQAYPQGQYGPLQHHGARCSGSRSTVYVRAAALDQAEARNAGLSEQMKVCLSLQRLMHTGQTTCTGKACGSAACSLPARKPAVASFVSDKEQANPAHTCRALACKIGL